MKTMLKNRDGRIWVLLCIMTFVLVGCGIADGRGAQVNPSSVTAAPVTTIPSTPQAVSPTATAAPLTPTPEAEDNKPVKISFMESDPVNANSMIRYMNIYRPKDGTPPYPTIFLVGPVDGGVIPPQQYKIVAQHFVDRRYAVIVLGYGSATKDSDLGCALAWVSQNAIGYDLDMESFYAFGHIAGGMQLIYYGLSATDAVYHQQVFGGCPYPYPGPDLFKGIVTYDPILGILEGGSIEMYGMLYASFMNMDGAEIRRITEILKDHPADTWFGNPEFDEATQVFIRRLPIYWIYARDHTQFASPLLLIDSDADGELDFVHEVASFTTHLDQQGLEYQVRHLNGVTRKGLIATDGKIAETIVDQADQFYRELMD